MTNESILIVGGGVAGLMIKNRLEALGYLPVLAEKADQLRTEGAGLLLGANVLKIFREIGLENELLAHSQVLDAMRSTDDKGNFLGRIDLEKIRLESGYPTITVHRHLLHDILSKSSNAGNFWLGHKVTDVKKTDSGYNISFENGKRSRFDRVIAADGIFSEVRNATIGDVGLRHTNQACWRFVVDTPEAVNVRTGIEMWGDRKRVGIFPIGQGKSYIFLVATMKGGESELAFDEVLEMFAEFEGEWDHFKNRIDTQKTELLFGELADTEMITLEKDGILFIGDAAHATTPNLGQGAAMGIESAYLFGELLGKHDFDTALEHYITTRYNRVNQIREKSMMAGKIAHTRSKTLQKIRNFIMQLIPQTLTQREFEKAVFE